MLAGLKTLWMDWGLCSPGRWHPSFQSQVSDTWTNWLRGISQRHGGQILQGQNQRPSKADIFSWLLAGSRSHHSVRRTWMTSDANGSACCLIRDKLRCWFRDSLFIFMHWHNHWDNWGTLMWTSLTTVRVRHLWVACIWAIFSHWGLLPRYIGGRLSSPSMTIRSGYRKMGNYFKGDECEAEKILSDQFKERRSWLDGWYLYRKRKPRGDILINLFASLPRASWRSRMGVTGSYMTAHMECSSTTRFWLKTDWKTQVQGKWRASWRHRWLLVSVAYFHWNADIAKAHRRVLVREGDWGVQACRTSSTSPVIWHKNKVGTFGVASAASFWWSRLMALIGRLGMRISVSDWALRFYKLCCCGWSSFGCWWRDGRWLTLWRFLVVMEDGWCPFFLSQIPWRLPIGLCWFLDGLFKIWDRPFLKEEPRGWVDFIKEMEHNDWLVNVKSVSRVPRSLGFLGTGAAMGWGLCYLLDTPGSAAVGKAATLRVPELLALSCIFIKEKFAKGLRKISLWSEGIGAWGTLQNGCQVRTRPSSAGWLVDWKPCRPLGSSLVFLDFDTCWSALAI